MAAILIAFLCGAGFHAVLMAVALFVWWGRRDLPAATKREIQRDRRRNRAELDLPELYTRHQWDAEDTGP